MRELLQKDRKVPAVNRPFYLESDFYKMANTLRAEFENQILATAEGSDGLTCLVYAFHADAYQFLTASADRIFGQEVLEDFMKRLREWATGAVGAASVSTPQTRVYISGCTRQLLQDSINAQWHYMLWLTGKDNYQKRAQIRLVTQGTPTDGHLVGVDRITDLHLEFNQLMVHNASDAYAIEPATTSMNPLDGAVFLDGYLW